MSKKNVKTPMKVIPKNSRIFWHSYVADKGGCGHIRVIIPSLLVNMKRFGNLNINLYPQYGMNYILDGEYYKNKLFVIFQRAATEDQLKIVKYLKNNVFNKTGTKIIYELDDDLIDVPEWNMAADFYNKNRKNSLEIISRSFGVTTSTEHLAKKIRKYNKNVKVIPNHLPKFVWGEIPEIKETEEKPKILWFGSSNHFSIPNSDKEGGDFGSELINFIRKTVDIYDWIFVGAMPKEIIDIKDKFYHYKWTTIFEYPSLIKSLNANVGIAPLLKHDFNRSKSNIKALEYIASGIPGVYTNITPYENLKNVCETDNYMIDRIEHLANNPDFRKETLEYDYNMVKDQLFWEENDNIKKYVDTYLNFFNMRLPNED